MRPFITLALVPSLTTTPLTMLVIVSPSQTTSIVFHSPVGFSASFFLTTRSFWTLPSTSIVVPLTSQKSPQSPSWIWHSIDFVQILSGPAQWTRMPESRTSFSRGG